MMNYMNAKVRELASRSYERKLSEFLDSLVGRLACVMPTTDEQLGWSGSTGQRTEIGFIIEQNGKVQDYEVFQSSGSDVADAVALNQFLRCLGDVPLPLPEGSPLALRFSASYGYEGFCSMKRLTKFPKGEYVEANVMPQVRKWLLENDTISKLKKDPDWKMEVGFVIHRTGTIIGRPLATENSGSKSIDNYFLDKISKVTFPELPTDHPDTLTVVLAIDHSWVTFIDDSFRDRSQDD